MAGRALTSEVAYIVGNGRSRDGFDLEQLIGSGTIWGCNALYRDWANEGSNRRFMLPDYLVSIDHGIISEIENSEFPSERFIVPDHDEQYEPAEVNPGRPRSNAGMNAMIEAIRKGANILICLGFDFLLPGNVTNMYDGTENYTMETRATAQDNKGRCRYLQWFVEQNPDVTFFFVYPKFDKDIHDDSVLDCTVERRHRQPAFPATSRDIVVPIAGERVHYCTYEQLLANLEE